MPSHFPLGLPPAEVSLLEVLLAGRVDRPIVAFPVGGSSCLHKAVVDGQVVPDGVSPTMTSVAEIGKVIQDVLVDVSQDELLLGRTQDSHRDEANVGMLRLRLFGEIHSEESRIQLGERKHGQVRRWAKSWRERVWEKGREGAEGLQEPHSVSKGEGVEVLKPGGLWRGCCGCHGGQQETGMTGCGGCLHRQSWSVIYWLVFNCYKHLPSGLPAISAAGLPLADPRGGAPTASQ